MERELFLNIRNLIGGFSLFGLQAGWMANVMNLLGYVLFSLALYTLASRRGIRNPWLSWLPVGNIWILGTLSDQYRAVTMGQTRNRRKVLLILELVMAVVTMVAVVLSFAFLFGVFSGMVDESKDPEELFLSMVLSAGPLMLLMLPLMGLAIAMAVLRLMALYDVFRSCNSGSATLFLIFSILVSIAGPVLLFVSRNSDEGMKRKGGQNSGGSAGNSSAKYKTYTAHTDSRDPWDRPPTKPNTYDHVTKEPWDIPED